MGWLMDELVKKIVARIYRQDVPFSRNKNFSTFEDPKVKQAARLCRRLHNLEAELLEQDSHCTLEDAEDGVQVRLVIETLSYRRTTFLQPFELELLLENEAIQGVLSRRRAALKRVAMAKPDGGLEATGTKASS